MADNFYIILKIIFIINILLVLITNTSNAYYINNYKNNHLITSIISTCFVSYLLMYLILINNVK